MIVHVKKEPFLTVLILLALILPFISGQDLHHFYLFIHWNTIVSITGLLIITTAIKESGFFEALSYKIFRLVRTERELALFLTIWSLFLSMIITNDISLLIILPLTLSLKKTLKNELNILLVLETIAVNVGSALTPIGNPQNLFLWHMWEISFFSFVIKMLPLELLMLLLLLIFIFIIFKNQPLTFSDTDKNMGFDKNLLVISMLLLVVYIVSIELHIDAWLLPVVVIIYLFIYKKTLLQTDWLLIITFIFMFFDFHLLAKIPLIETLMKSANYQKSSNVFLMSLISSQIISNVPATIFMSKFTQKWFAIAYGVNVGGNGLIIGSLANIITLRVVEKKFLLVFHKISIPFLLITAVFAYLIFF